MSWREINTWQRNTEINALDGLKWAQGFLKQTPWRSLNIPLNSLKELQQGGFAFSNLTWRQRKSSACFKEAKERFEDRFHSIKLSVWRLCESHHRHGCIRGLSRCAWCINEFEVEQFCNVQPNLWPFYLWFLAIALHWIVLFSRSDCHLQV